MDKQHIIAEIKRTAEANSGAPLGYKKFAEITGIRQSDWRGRFWIRWSDALQEAGFAPNSFVTPAYDRNAALSHMANFARKLGHLPVEAEWEMKRRSDVTFPSVKVFRSLGKSGERVQVLAEFCRSSGEYQDVLEMCHARAAAAGTKTNGTSEQTETDAAEPQLGFVYLLKSGRYYKIGRSNAAGRRERELQIQLPEKAVNVHTIRTDDPPGIEDYWHRRFADRRKNGEWFDLDASDVRAFKRRKFM